MKNTKIEMRRRQARTSGLGDTWEIIKSYVREGSAKVDVSNSEYMSKRLGANKDPNSIYERAVSKHRSDVLTQKSIRKAYQSKNK
jgi:hypothetical protein